MPHAPPTSARKVPTPNDVGAARAAAGQREAAPVGGSAPLRKGRRSGEVGGRPAGGRCIRLCGSRRRRGRQRLRLRARGRGRVDPPSRSAARSSTINVPSDTIRVPSGSIGLPSLSGDCRGRMISRATGARYRPKVGIFVRRMTYVWGNGVLSRAPERAGAGRRARGRAARPACRSGGSGRRSQRSSRRCRAAPPRTDRTLLRS